MVLLRRLWLTLVVILASACDRPAQDLVPETATASSSAPSAAALELSRGRIDLVEGNIVIRHPLNDQERAWLSAQKRFGTDDKIRVAADRFDRELESLLPLRGRVQKLSLLGELEHSAQLTALERFTELRELSLFAIRTPDLAFLASLPELRKLDIMDGYLPHPKALEPLSKTRNLEVVEIGLGHGSFTVKPTGRVTDHDAGTTSIDLQPLRSHTGLRELELSLVAPESLTPLTAFRRLERLQLSGTPKAGGWTTLSSLTTLRELILPKSFTELSHLRPLKKLQELSLYSTNPQPWSALSSLPELVRLELVYAETIPWRQLRKLSSLRKLGVNKQAAHDKDVAAFRRQRSDVKLALYEM